MTNLIPSCPQCKNRLFSIYVGGIKEKILAAKRANITDIVLPEENRKDINAINSIYLKGLKFHYVNDLMDVVKKALLQEKVKSSVKV